MRLDSEGGGYALHAGWFSHLTLVTRRFTMDNEVDLLFGQ